MNEPEKREIQEELKMVYKIDQFIDGNPYIEERIEKRSEKVGAQRFAQGVVKGEIQSLQRLAIIAIERRFPALLDQAQTRIEQIQNTDALDELILQLAAVMTEREVRQILQIQEKQ